jgi:hypothetical protein
MEFSTKFNRLIKKKKVRTDKDGKPIDGGDGDDSPDGGKKVKKLHAGKLSVVPKLVLAELRDNVSEALSFRQFTFGPKGTTTLALALFNNESLTHLDLRRNNVRSKGVEALSGALAVNHSITELHLEENHITASGCVHLATALASNRTLRTLHLGSNNCGNQGMVALGKGLAENDTLHTLNLQRNGVGEAGAAALVAALRAPTCHLKRLDLANNSLGNKGAMAFAEGLQHIRGDGNDSGVEVLNIEWNNITTEGGTALADAMFLNTSVTDLKVFTNLVGDYAFWHIPRYVKENKAFVVLRQQRQLVRERKLAFLVGVHTGDAAHPLRMLAAATTADADGDVTAIADAGVVARVFEFAFDANERFVHTFKALPLRLAGEWGGKGGHKVRVDVDAGTAAAGVTADREEFARSGVRIPGEVYDAAAAARVVAAKSSARSGGGGGGASLRRPLRSTAASVSPAARRKQKKMTVHSTSYSNYSKLTPETRRLFEPIAKRDLGEMFKRASPVKSQLRFDADIDAAASEFGNQDAAGPRPSSRVSTATPVVYPQQSSRVSTATPLSPRKLPPIVSIKSQ